jgi:hypothetical protein
MAENGRVDIIVKQLDRIEGKLDQLTRDTNDDFDVVHNRINKVENRVSRIEGIGGALQVVWGGLLMFLSWNRRG